MPKTAPYGSWPSPITAESLVSGAVGISEVVPEGADIWWAEARPDEGGRTALVRWRDGSAEEVTPPDAYVRTLVHEYGGGSWWAEEGVAYYVDLSDQRLRKLVPGEPPIMLSPEPDEPGGERFADFRPTPDGAWLVGVRERHRQRGEPANEIVAVATDGSLDVRTLWSHSDFVSSPRVSPDGRVLAWLAWDHPNMPWDSTTLWIGELRDGKLHAPREAVGNGDEALVQPEWDEHQNLYVCSDRNEWWNVYRVDGASLVPIVQGGFEVSTPPWVFNMSRYAITPSGPVTAQARPGGDRIAVSSRVLPIVDDTAISSVRATDAGDVVYVGAGFDHEAQVIRLRLGGVTPRREVIRRSRDLGLAKGYLPAPEAISFPSGEGERAHALFYGPAHPDFVGPADERPPLMVLAHGGPTAAARRQVQLAQRFFTSRGFAVVDVDYRGSTGYGRIYRQALNGRWGVADVEDCVAAASALAKRGDVDPQRLVIRGGSAGGYTVLCALCFHDVFAAGADHYGVADLEALATDTHKFEARYLDNLVGPYPAERAVYRKRSPIHHVDGFSAPMIVLQGAEDAIVPPNQSEMIVDALKSSGIPVAYLLFAGEQHGFRQAENIIRALESELAFFGDVLDFTPADDLPAVPYA